MPANHTEVEKRLWEAADELRANSKLKSSEYSVPVLGLIFLRYADQKFAEAEKKLTAAGSGRRKIGKIDYQAQGVLFIPEKARFANLLNLPEGADIGKAINEAMKSIEAENEDLKDVLPKTYNALEKGLLVSLLKNFSATGMRIYKELICMRKNQLDLNNAVVWISDSKTPNGEAEVPLTELALDAFRNQLAISGAGQYLFPSGATDRGHQKSFKTAWRAALRRAKVPYFRIYDLRSTYATRLSAGGVADEWVTQLLRQGDAQVFKKYSQMKLQMKREALRQLNRQANEMRGSIGTLVVN